MFPAGDLVQRVMDDYKEKQDSLVQENSELRESLYKMQYELAVLARLSHLEPGCKSVLLPSEISRETALVSCDKVLAAVADK